MQTYQTIELKTLGAAVILLELLAHIHNVPGMLLSESCLLYGGGPAIFVCLLLEVFGFLFIEDRLRSGASSRFFLLVSHGNGG